MASLSRSRSSSGSDYDPRNAVPDERKRKRMESNRESARRSRMKKQKMIDDLLAQVSQLKNENRRLVHSIDETTQKFVEVNSRNDVLRAQLSELTERLASLNSVLHIMEQASGLAIDIPEMPDTLMNTWRLPYPVQQPIMASMDLFQA